MHWQSEQLNPPRFQDYTLVIASIKILKLQIFERTSVELACDFCYHKKIKCDSAKPQCSPCKLYNAECTYVAKTRQHVPKQNTTSSRIDSLEERLRSVEAQLQSMGSGSSGNDQSAATQPNTISPLGVGARGTRDYSATSSFPETPQVLGVLDGLGMSPDTVTSMFGRATSVAPAPELYSPDKLPPFHQIRPVIEKYFTTGNAVLPLFHSPSFFRILNNFYSISASRTKASWAIINTAIALSQTPFGNHDTTVPYVRNARAVLDDLVLSGTDGMASLQITIGLAGIFYGSPDFMTSCSVLVSLAVRLAQRLRLYSKAQPPEAEYSETEKLERNRLFWLTYIMDRDMSAKTRNPPLLRDEDIDVDLPALDPEDGAGVVVSCDGNAKFNILRSRIQIAWVQGKIYDWICSARAARTPLAQRVQLTQKLEKVLQEWKNGVPSPFLPENVTSETDPGTLRFFMILHWEHFMCQAMIRGTHIHNRPWLLRLAGNASSLMTTYFRELGKNVTPEAGERSYLPVMRWDSLIQGTRECMKMTKDIDPIDKHLLLSIAAGYFSGACVILAHLLENPFDPMLTTDKLLIEACGENLERIVKDSGIKKVMYFQQAYNEISSRVRERINSAPMFGAEGGSDVEQLERIPNVWPELSDFEYTFAEIDSVSSADLSLSPFVEF
ncbi:fungal specific transcription factor domain-containing protein [Zalerion maritima]|uniref:Fungal specific transcription factor domain-containing protein n=1 Tax=Zalerion maritima TaxID=339359 RepID=A0AAD5WRT7_9PEZI|nr:fungal specific transcription factor domain-containing protein [Zalerion maritima]